jgi:hypothetical protein
MDKVKHPEELHSQMSLKGDYINLFSIRFVKSFVFLNSLSKVKLGFQELNWQLKLGKGPRYVNRINI